MTGWRVMVAGGDGDGRSPSSVPAEVFSFGPGGSVPLGRAFFCVTHWPCARLASVVRARWASEVRSRELRGLHRGHRPPAEYPWNKSIAGEVGRRARCGRWVAGRVPSGPCSACRQFGSLLLRVGGLRRHERVEAHASWSVSGARGASG